VTQKICPHRIEQKLYEKPERLDEAKTADTPVGTMKKWTLWIRHFATDDWQLRKNGQLTFEYRRQRRSICVPISNAEDCFVELTTISLRCAKLYWLVLSTYQFLQLLSLFHS
jgi:hypothetical protein